MHLCELPEPPGLINVGAGEDLSILELAKTIADVIEFKGEIKNEPDKPDGTPGKLMDSSKINALGWKPEISLRDGLVSTYRDYLENVFSA